MIMNCYTTRGGTFTCHEIVENIGQAQMISDVLNAIPMILKIIMVLSLVALVLVLIWAVIMRKKYEEALEEKKKWMETEYY